MTDSVPINYEDKDIQTLAKLFLESEIVDEDLNERISEALMCDIWDISEETIEENLPLFKQMFTKVIEIHDGFDVFGATSHPELFAHVMSMATPEVDVIGMMLAYADGPENLEAILSMMSGRNIKAPAELVNRHFGDEALKWCGWAKTPDEANSLRAFLTAQPKQAQ